MRAMFDTREHTRERAQMPIAQYQQETVGEQCVDTVSGAPIFGVPKREQSRFFRENKYEQLHDALCSGKLETLNLGLAVLGAKEFLTAISENDWRSFVTAGKNGHVEAVTLVLSTLREQDTYWQRFRGKKHPEKKKSVQDLVAMTLENDGLVQIVKAKQLEVVQAILSFAPDEKWQAGLIRGRPGVFGEPGSYEAFHASAANGDVKMCKVLAAYLQVAGCIDDALKGGVLGKQDEGARYKGLKKALSVDSSDVVKTLLNFASEELRDELKRRFVPSFVYSELSGRIVFSERFITYSVTGTALRNLLAHEDAFSSAECLSDIFTTERRGYIENLVAGKRLDLIQALADTDDNRLWAAIFRKFPVDFKELYSNIAKKTPYNREQILGHRDLNIHYNSGQARWIAVTGAQAPDGLKAESPFKFQKKATREAFAILEQRLKEYASVLPDYRRSAFSLAVIFQNTERAEKYVDKWLEKAEDDLDIKQTLHVTIPQHGVWTPHIWAERLLRFGPGELRHVKQADVLEDYFSTRESIEGLSTFELNAYVAREYYQTDEHPAWAMEAFEHGLDDEIFETGCEVLDDVKSAHALPFVRIDGAKLPAPYRNPNYELVQLAPEDPRNLMIGYHVNCCNHIAGGETADIAKAHVTDENVACYVIQRKATKHSPPTVVAKVSAAYTHAGDVL